MGDLGKDSPYLASRRGSERINKPSARGDGSQIKITVAKIGKEHGII